MAWVRNLPGDEVKLKQAPDPPPVKLMCICGNGEVLPDKPGAAVNPIAAEHKPQRRRGKS